MSVMPYAYAEDIAVADIAFHAWGQTLEETFRAAADATVQAMVENPEAIAPLQQRAFALHDERLDLLLLQFLQEFVYYKDAERLLLRVQEVAINREGANFILRGRAAGDTINPNTHELGADVKGVTLHRLQVVQTANGWEATVILDV
jgi:SHS2 domain-containing protein